MARPLRLEYPNALYHITARGNERKKIFRQDQDYKAFIKILAQVTEEKNWLCHSYCLMPNHYHLLLETPEPNLSNGMRQLNGIYSQKFNYTHKRVGHLFQGRFKAIIVEKEVHLLELCRYIALNPVRANIIDLPEEWVFSSYRATIGRIKTPSFLYSDWLLAQFSSHRNKARAVYRKFVADGMTEPSPLSKVVGQIYLGSEIFRAEMEEKLQNRAIASEIPNTQRYPVRPEIEEIIVQVAKTFKVERLHLIITGKATEARALAIYLCRQLGGYDLNVIADHFDIGYTRVSQIVGKVRERIISDKKLERQLKLLKKQLMSLDRKLKT